ncbi:MAG: fatty acid desaturase, partial [Leptospiraceae bacterium]|nr:fatty acid desaturase [Leptospiraceae bacterium]
MIREYGRPIAYLFCYSIPLAAFLGLWQGGAWVYAAPIIAFVLIPGVELFAPGWTINADPVIENQRKHMRLYDLVVYLSVPIQMTLVAYFIYQLRLPAQYATYELVGIIWSVGLSCGSLGINVAHELGHRKKKSEQWMAKALLLSSLYMHFIIEHNLGHHRHVATPRDPATARKGENLYQ